MEQTVLMIALGLLLIAAIIAGVYLLRQREKYCHLCGRYMTSHSDVCSHFKVAKLARQNLDCEFSQVCAEDAGRHCNHSSGQEGVCTLHGQCCPSFLLDAQRNEQMCH